MSEPTTGSLRSKHTAREKHILAAYPVARLAFLTYFHRDFWELELRTLAAVGYCSHTVPEVKHRHFLGVRRWGVVGRVVGCVQTLWVPDKRTRPRL